MKRKNKLIQIDIRIKLNIYTIDRYQKQILRKTIHSKMFFNFQNAFDKLFFIVAYMHNHDIHKINEFFSSKIENVIFNIFSSFNIRLTFAHFISSILFNIRSTFANLISLISFNIRSTFANLISSSFQTFKQKNHFQLNEKQITIQIYNERMNNLRKQKIKLIRNVKTKQLKKKIAKYVLQLQN